MLISQELPVLFVYKCNNIKMFA